MMTDIVAVENFDYSTVGTETASQLISHAGDINRQKGIGLKSMLAMGETISEAHDLLASHGYGTFGKWVEAECGISRASASRYLNAYKTFGLDCLSPETNITAEAMYALSAPSAPPAAAKKAKAMAAKGVKVTDRVAKQIITKTVPTKKPSNELREAALEAGPSFDPEELDRQPAREAISQKNGKPVVSKKVRSEAQKHLGGLIRALMAMDIYDEFTTSLSQVATRLKQV